MVLTLNNLEHVLQYMSLLPADLDIDLSSSRISVSSANSDSLSDETKTPEGVEEQDCELFTKLSTALDHMDMIIYTVLETLQGKVSKSSIGFWNSNFRLLPAVQYSSNLPYLPTYSTYASTTHLWRQISLWKETFPRSDVSRSFN